MSETAATRGRGHRRPLIVRGGLAIALSVLANGALVVGISALDLAPGFRALTLPPVVFLSALGAAGAVVAYWLMHQYVADADRAFVRVAAGVLVLSFAPDVALLVFDPAATLPGVVVLVLMHVIVAVVSVAALVYWGRER